jgi:hypothetical protein
VTGRSPLWTGLTLLLLAAPGLWAQEAPDALLDGFVANGGVRLAF